MRSIALTPRLDLAMENWSFQAKQNINLLEITHRYVTKLIINYARIRSKISVYMYLYNIPSLIGLLI